MLNMPALTPRLRQVMEFVRPGVPVADVGTDHAYLAVYLVNSGKSPRCIASDINSGPLARARETVLKYGAEDKVELRLSDGLDGYPSEAARDIVIAGMGGELILSIVKSCPWLRNPDVRLVLQPMTAQPELRKGLYAEEFEILREAVAREGDKLYLVISVRYTGVQKHMDELFCVAGTLPENDDELSADYLRWQAEVMRKRAAGMIQSKIKLPDTEKIKKLSGELQKLSLYFRKKELF